MRLMGTLCVQVCYLMVSMVNLQWFPRARVGARWTTEVHLRRVDRLKNTKTYVEEHCAFTVPCLVVTCTSEAYTLADPESYGIL